MGAELEGPLDPDLIRDEVQLVERDVVVALCEESLSLGGGPIEWSGERDLQRFATFWRGRPQHCVRGLCMLVSLSTLAFSLVEEGHDAQEVFSEVEGSYDDLDFISEGVEGLQDI